MLKKVISEIIALIFLFSVVSVDFARAATMPLAASNLNMNDASFLQNYAKITSLKNFNSDTVVLNIQDFHMHSGVQQNINSIIKALADNCNVQYIYLEGAYDKVNTNWLSNIENKEFKQAVIDKLIKDGKLTGAEIYSANNNKENFILPLEDKNIHKENIKRLAKIIEEKPEVLNKLNKREKELSFYQKKYLGSDNRKFSEIVKKYNSGKLDTYDFYKSLFSYLKKYQQSSKYRYGNVIDLNIDDYPNMDMYLQVYEIQSNIKLKAISEDLKVLIKNLKQELSYSEYSNLLKKTNNFTDRYALITSLDKLPKEYKQKYITKQLKDFIKSVKLQKNINPVELIEEERALIGQIRTTLSSNKAELEVSFLIDFFRYFKDFMLANISADDHQYFMGQIDKFINLWNKYSFYDKPMLELLERIPFINEYYAVNDYRNEIFVKKINIKNNNVSKKEFPTDSFFTLVNGKKVAVVITGGYHTKGLTDLLLKNNISYAVITPSVLGNIDNTYEKYEAAVREEAAISSQSLASAAISLIGLEQSYIIELLKEIQKDNSFNLNDIVKFIKVLNETKEQKIDYNYDEQNQKLTLSDGNTQITISNDNIETKILKKSQNTSVTFDTKKILEAVNENLKILSTNFGQDIFYPNLFEKIDSFETFLIERNLMPAISNGFIYEINNDIEFQQYYTEKYGEEKLEELSRAAYIVQLTKYYKYKANNQNGNENEEDLQEVLDEMEKLNNNGQLLAETDNIDYVEELRELEDFVAGKLNYKPEYAVYAAGGRIGQPDVWKLAEREDVKLSMITVSTSLSKEEVPYSVSHDSGLKSQKDNNGVHGDFDGEVKWYKEDELAKELSEKEYKEYEKYKEEDEKRVKEGKDRVFLGYLRMESNKKKAKTDDYVSNVAVFSTREPSDIDFTGKVVLNTSGAFKTEKQEGEKKGAEEFINKGLNKGKDKGADMVILSAPGEMPTYTNGTREAYKGERVFSGASCSTNALQSVLLPISENGMIESVTFGGIHAATNSDKGKNSGLEAHSSGASKATAKLPGLQYLKGKMTGSVIRYLEIPDGSILNVTIQLEEPIRGGKNEVNKILKQASQGKYKGILGYSDGDYSVKDIIGRTEAGILQADQTMVSEDGKEIILSVWYDNEVGYANQYLDLSYYAGMYPIMKNNMLDLLDKVGIDITTFENNNVSLKEIYKVFRHDVMTDSDKMEIIKQQAAEGNEFAKGILNLTTTIAQDDILNVPEGEHKTFVNMKNDEDDLLVQAKIGGYAVGAFNMNNLDQLKAIADAAIQDNSPLMIEISEGALGYSADNPVKMEKFNYLVETYKMIAATMPGLEMILHLDHSKTLETVKVINDKGEEEEEYHAVVAAKAIDMGFSSVMLDCSQESMEKNIKATKWLVDYAHERGAKVEAEIGAVDKGAEGYTIPRDAVNFVKETKVDSLAIAVGTAHGENKNNPQLQFVRIAEIAYALYEKGIEIPLVLHGASAVPEELIERFNKAGGKKKNASGVDMEDTKDAITWGWAKYEYNNKNEIVVKDGEGLLFRAYKELQNKKAKEGSQDIKDLDSISADISKNNLEHTGVISKVNVATDILVAGAVGIKESIKEGKGVDHIAEQKEATKLVKGKMDEKEGLGSEQKITTGKAKRKVIENFPAKATKTAKELKNKANLRQYNIGSIEEIQAVINTSEAGDNIIFTIDEKNAERFNYIGYNELGQQQKYNALVFAIEVAAQNNKDINIAVNLIKSNDIDKMLTNIIKKTYQYNAEKGSFELKLDNLTDAELIYLNYAVNNGAIMNLQEIADDITEQFHKNKKDKHDVRDWGKEYRNIIWELLEKINNGDIEGYIDTENSFESIEEVIYEIKKLEKEMQETVKENSIDYVDELRDLEDKLENNIKTKPEYAVYAAGGRIGQPNVWALAEREDVKLSMITVSTSLSKEEVPYSISHDSGLKFQEGKGETIHGDFDGEVRWYKEDELVRELSEKEYKEYEKYKEEDKKRVKEGKDRVFLGYLRIESNKTSKISNVAVFATREPSDIDFTGKVVLNTSGAFKTEKQEGEKKGAEEFINKGLNKGKDKGADMVILSAPGEMPTYTNGTREAYKGERVFSGASCSTNALQSVLLPINDNGRIESVTFSGAHAATNSQYEKDEDYKDGIEPDFSPHSSGANKATVMLDGLEYLDGKIIGNVNRVSTVMDGSILDVTIHLDKPISNGSDEDCILKVNEMLKKASEGKYKGVLGYAEGDFGLGDIIGRTEAGVVQANKTLVTNNGKTIKLYVWYDNEVGYANQYLEMSVYANKQKQMKKDIIDLLEKAGIDTKNLEGNVSLKQVYKVLRDEVITNEERMNIIKQEAEKGIYAAQAVVELAQEREIEPIEQTTKKATTIKEEGNKVNNFFRAIKSIFNRLTGNNIIKTLDVDLIYVKDFQSDIQKKFNKNDDKLTLYISPFKNQKGLSPSGIKGVYVNKYTGVIYISSEQDIDLITSNMSVIVGNFINTDNSDFSVVFSNEDSVDEDVLSIDKDGVIKTSSNFIDAARNVIKSLTGFMSRNLIIVLEDNNIEKQLKCMKEIGNNTITVSAKYFNKDDEVIKDELANLEKNYGISVIIEYQQEIDEKTEIRNAKLGFVGHTIKTKDGFIYKNYSLNEIVTNYSICEDIKSFSGIKSSNEVVFIKGNALVSYIKERTKLGDRLDAINLLTNIITKFVKFINKDIDENLIENFVFELPKNNIPELSQSKINELQNVENIIVLRKELNIKDIKELTLFEEKIIRLAKEQNKDENQLLLVYYQTILKAAYLNNRFYNDNPLGFENRNVAKMAERNALVELDATRQKTVQNIINIKNNSDSDFRKIEDSMPASELADFVYELGYYLENGKFDSAEALLRQKGILNSINFESWKDENIAKALTFELLILFADRKINIDFDKDDDIDDIKNVANILTAA